MQILSAALALLLAVGVGALALSLRGKTATGFFLGGGMQAYGIVAWTFDGTRYQQKAVWACLAIIGAVAIVWTFPTWRGWIGLGPREDREGRASWRELIKLGGVWLGIPLWLFGAIAAVILGRFGVAGQRIVYFGFMVALAVLVFHGVRTRKKDITVGIASAALFSLAILMAAGCQYLFTAGDHYTARSSWGGGQTDRFWGGPLALFHPNAIAMTALIIAVRIAPDKTFARWQRLGVLATTALLLVVTASRTSWLLTMFAAGLYGLLVIWRAGLPRWRFWAWLSTRDWRRTVGLALLPLIGTIALFAVSGGIDLMTKCRYGCEDKQTVNLSGRGETWLMIGKDWVDDTVVEKALGNTDNNRGYILRERDKSKEYYAKQPKLGADNSAIAAFRRGGLLGLAAFAMGVVLIIRRVTRTGLPLWSTLTGLALLGTGMTEDELVWLGPPWLMLLAVEAWALWQAPDETPEPSAGST